MIIPPPRPLTIGHWFVIRVLFVCLGNICRSPTAEGVFRTLVHRRGLADRIEADSAGTAAYHIGEPPDERSCLAAWDRGFDLRHIRARKVRAIDFERFHYVLAMDRQNHRRLVGLCPRGREDRLHMFLDFAPEVGLREVPDPYYGGPRGFEHVLDLVEAASEGLIADIRSRHLSDTG